MVIGDALAMIYNYWSFKMLFSRFWLSVRWRWYGLVEDVDNPRVLKTRGPIPYQWTCICVYSICVQKRIVRLQKPNDGDRLHLKELGRKGAEPARDEHRRDRGKEVRHEKLVLKKSLDRSPLLSKRLLPCHSLHVGPLYLGLIGLKKKLKSYVGSLAAYGTWRLVSDQVVNCCVYELTKQQRQRVKGNNQICLTMGQIQAFTSFY